MRAMGQVGNVVEQECRRSESEREEFQTTTISTMSTSIAIHLLPCQSLYPLVAARPHAHATFESFVQSERFSASLISSHHLPPFLFLRGGVTAAAQSVTRLDICMRDMWWGKHKH